MNGNIITDNFTKLISRYFLFKVTYKFNNNKTKEEKYLKAMQLLRQQLTVHPRTQSGGFWHKKIYPNQMWLDGLYMGEPFYAEYTLTFENGKSFGQNLKDTLENMFKTMILRPVIQPILTGVVGAVTGAFSAGALAGGAPRGQPRVLPRAALAPAACAGDGAAKWPGRRCCSAVDDKTKRESVVFECLICRKG